MPCDYFACWTDIHSTHSLSFGCDLDMVTLLHLGSSRACSCVLPLNNDTRSHLETTWLRVSFSVRSTLVVHSCFCIWMWIHNSTIKLCFLPRGCSQNEVLATGWPGIMCSPWIGSLPASGTEVFRAIVNCWKRRHRSCACSDSQVWGYKLEICMALRPTLPTGFILYTAV